MANAELYTADEAERLENAIKAEEFARADAQEAHFAEALDASQVTPAHSPEAVPAKGHYDGDPAKCPYLGRIATQDPARLERLLRLSSAPVPKMPQEEPAAQPRESLADIFQKKPVVDDESRHALFAAKEQRHADENLPKVPVAVRRIDYELAERVQHEAFRRAKVETDTAVRQVVPDVTHKEKLPESPVVPSVAQKIVLSKPIAKPATAVKTTEKRQPSPSGSTNNESIPKQPREEVVDRAPSLLKIEKAPPKVAQQAPPAVDAKLKIAAERKASRKSSNVQRAPAQKRISKQPKIANQQTKSPVRSIETPVKVHEPSVKVQPEIIVPKVARPTVQEALADSIVRAVSITTEQRPKENIDDTPDHKPPIMESPDAVQEDAHSDAPKRDINTEQQPAEQTLPEQVVVAARTEIALPMALAKLESKPETPTEKAIYVATEQLEKKVEQALSSQEAQAIVEQLIPKLETRYVEHFVSIGFTRPEAKMAAHIAVERIERRLLTQPKAEATRAQATYFQGTRERKQSLLARASSVLNDKLDGALQESRFLQFAQYLVQISTR